MAASRARTAVEVRVLVDVDMFAPRGLLDGSELITVIEDGRIRGDYPEIARGLVSWTPCHNGLVDT
jgi:hypothetical protein